MGRRICDTDATTAVEPARKRTRTVSESCELNSSVIIDQPLPPGEILTDVTQKQWRIGKPIGEYFTFLSYDMASFKTLKYSCLYL